MGSKPTSRLSASRSGNDPKRASSTAQAFIFRNHRSRYLADLQTWREQCRTLAISGTAIDVCFRNFGTLRTIRRRAIEAGAGVQSGFRVVLLVDRSRRVFDQTHAAGQREAKLPSFPCQTRGLPAFWRRLALVLVLVYLLDSVAALCSQGVGLLVMEVVRFHHHRLSVASIGDRETSRAPAQYGSSGMQFRSTRTVSRNSSVQVSQFGAINFDIGTLTSNNFDKDAQIFGEGELSEHVYEVVVGAVRSSMLLSDGRCQVTAFHLPGDIFGLDLSAAHLTSAEAIVATTLRVANRQSLQQAAAANAAIAHALWCLTASNLKHAEDHLLLLGRKTAFERVATFLVEMSNRLDVDGNGKIPLPMSRRDIGDYLGLTFETVSRVLSALHNNGVISFSGDARHIVLLKRSHLRMELLPTKLK